MIADLINNKKVNPVVTELCVRGRKLNTSTVLKGNHILHDQKCQTKFYPLFHY